MKFNKDGMGIRILQKSKKWISDIYNKEKWFWEDGWSKLIKVRSKAHFEWGEKEKKGERENNEIKFLTELIRGRRQAKWNEIVGEYSMGFKVQISSEQIRVPLENYSNNHGISPN